MKGNNQKRPQWVTMNKNALCGNILVTGSIGSGKTQGTILPYLDQITSNFEVTPSILIIDPKRSFIPKAKKILNKNGLEERVLHLKLGGDVYINPVYQKDILRESNFLNTAHMFQAASINFMGSHKENSFWNLSAFNLIKNVIIYCAATLGYFTLEDIYKAIIKSSENDLVEELINSLEENKFDQEERFNIKSAISYFKHEYQRLESKLRTNILASATVFINQFQEYRANKIFCPKEEDISVNSVDQLIDDGQILLIDIESPPLARSMGTYLKLLFQQSVLNRISDPNRDKNRSFVMVIDEYQDVATVGGGNIIGDERFLSKSREANAISIIATQSLVSLLNSIGSESAIKELIQNFRTRIAGHSTDLYTTKNFQELMGKEEIERLSHSFGEFTQNAKRNIILGQFESNQANISESINKSMQTDYKITAKEFARLKTFETFAHIYDGVSTSFNKLYLKPYFIKNKRTNHKNILKTITKTFSILILAVLFSQEINGFPNICDVVNTKSFESCLDYNVENDVCPWGPFSRPCARVSYYVPTTFVEVFPNEGQTFFEDLPGAKLQLSTLDKSIFPFGVEDNDHTYSFHAHTLAVPFDFAFQGMMCGGTRIEKFCFDAMSEHVRHHWRSGDGDRSQPLYLAWQLNPKACLIKGALTSVTGAPELTYGSDTLCSLPFEWYKTFPPSAHSVCNGWGIMFPRMGTYHGTSQVTAALMIAARMKSLSSEVFQATPSALFEKWQMIYPNKTSCFREGQNMSLLEIPLNVNEIGRLKKLKKGFLFVIWQKTTCKRDWPAVWVSKGIKSIIKGVCKGLGGL